jgi:hypothetical protein
MKWLLSAAALTLVGVAFYRWDGCRHIFWKGERMFVCASDTNRE